jgi:LysM repeat protein
LSTKLKRIVETLAVAVLWMALLAALPGTAEAQGMASTEAARDADRVVVAPGDSLWSIASEQLGPQATPPRIDREVERIYALNRDRIGPDPDLIFPGQELLVPPVAERPASEHAPAGATRSEEATGGAQAGPNKGRAAAEGEAEQAPRTAAVGEGEKAPDRVVEAPNLPETVEAPAVSPVDSDASSTGTPVASFLRSARSVVSSGASALGETLTEARASPGERRMLGGAIIAVTVVVVALMAWKLPMRRTTRWDAESWGIPTGYRAAGYRRNAPESVSPPAAHTSAGERRDQQRTGKETGDVNTPERRRTSPARAPNGRPSPSGGLALGAHDGRVRRALLRARTPARARKARAASSLAARRARPRLRPWRHSRPNKGGAEQR